MSRAKKFLLISLLLVTVIVLSFSAGCLIGFGAAAETSGLKTIEQAWNIIFSEYVDPAKLDSAAFSRAAIDAILEKLDDPHSAYIDVHTYNQLTTQFQGTFEGIGAWVGKRDNQIVIIAPTPDSPAEKAGIRAGDVILEIDGKSTEGLSAEESVLLIRGNVGTTVSLLVLHPDEKQPVKIDVVRAQINLPSASHEMRDEIGYIKIFNFSERTNEELTPMLASITQGGAKGLILDLRSNPGGVLQTAVDIASRFIKEGTVVGVVDNQGNTNTLPVTSQPKIDLPVVVLVDEHSASASEVLAGALQDYGRATIAGNKTFGKGSVNLLHRLNDGSGLYITTGRWLTPKGRLIEGKGIEPDIALELEGDAAINWAVDYLNNISQNR